jgi:hypothetical protein
MAQQSSDLVSAGLTSAIADYWCGSLTGPRLSVVAEPSYRQMLDVLAPDLSAVADAAVACIRADEASGEPFVVPTVYADFGTISTARLFGGRVTPPHDGGKVHIAPVAQTVAELTALSRAPFEESDFQLAVRLYRLVCERLGHDQVYLRTPDFQGPMNTLALVMEQQALMVALYEEPEAIHAALAMITETLIAYHQRLRRELGGGKIIGNIWPYTILPETIGVALTQDMMPLLGPRLYRDFELPCLQRIAAALGPLQIHCCGKYAQHLPALKASGLPILGLEFHHPFTPFAAVHQVFGDEIVYIPYLFGSGHDYPSQAAFVTDLLRQGTPRTRFWFAWTQGWGELPALRHLLGAAGAPIVAH